MVRKTDIKEALNSKKIFEIAKEDYNAFKTFITLSIREYYTRTGQKAEGNELFLKDTISITCEDLKKHFNYMPLNEFKLALEYGANGVFGDIKHACDATFKFYLTSYLALPIRAIVLQEIQNEQIKNVNMLSENGTWSESDEIEAMRKRYKEALNCYRNGKTFIDSGGRLFDFLQSKEFISFDEDDVRQIEYDLLKQKKSGILGIFNRELLKKHFDNGKYDHTSPLYFIAKAKVLKEYFIMEIEARAINKKK